ncbi:MAG: triose-phosphate isomerase, partial [Caulobacteraceae bacterium]
PGRAEIEDVHGALRATLVARFGARHGTQPILYGGSVKAANAREILELPEVGGALVGGASLKATEFAAIVAAC